MSASELNGRGLIEQGYSLVYGGKWPILETPDNRLMDSVEKVRIGPESYYAFELVAAIERALDDRKNRKTKRGMLRDHLLDHIHTSAPISMDK